jgi:hypothetical protein
MNSEDNSGEIAVLKNQVFTLLVALIVVSGTLTVYLYRQTSMTGKDIEQNEQVMNLVAKNQTSIDAFVARLADYGKRHPDFQPILKKYGITPGGPAAPKK